MKLKQPYNRREQKNRCPKIFDGEKEAYLIAIACSKTPTGKSNWTLQMLADKMVELNIDFLSQVREKEKELENGNQSG